MKRLDPWLQEAILDELDALAANPGVLRRSGTSPVAVADLIRDFEKQRHYVFLSIEVNVTARRLELVDVGHYSRPI